MEHLSLSICSRRDDNESVVKKSQVMVLDHYEDLEDAQSCVRAAVLGKGDLPKVESGNIVKSRREEVVPWKEPVRVPQDLVQTTRQERKRHELRHCLYKISCES